METDDMTILLAAVMGKPESELLEGEVHIHTFRLHEPAEFVPIKRSTLAINMDGATLSMILDDPRAKQVVLNNILAAMAKGEVTGLTLENAVTGEPTTFQEAIERIVREHQTHPQPTEQA